MESKNETLDNLRKLLGEWKIAMEKDNELSFWNDGVEYWRFKSAEEDEELKRYEKWDSLKGSGHKKILFVGRDYNTERKNKKINGQETYGDIAKEGSGYFDDNFKTSDMYTMICKYIYMKFIIDGSSFKDIENHIENYINNKTEEVKKFFNNYPYGWINIKKSGGKSTSYPHEIIDHLKKYGKFLLKEIEILNPTDIVCFGYDGYEKTLIEKLEGIRTLDYAPVIHKAYHPSALGYKSIGHEKSNREKMYNSLKKWDCQTQTFKKI